MNNLKHYRELAGVTQDELADELDMSQGAISHIETGRTVTLPLKTAQSIVAALNEKLEARGEPHVDVSVVFPPDSENSEAAA